ncbi:MAG: hypothetical protein KAU14_07970 [Thermoplasmata archaeon]|nr:hypothetical protein [Thermoplasmata archaeon]
MSKVFTFMAFQDTQKGENKALAYQKIDESKNASINQRQISLLKKYLRIWIILQLVIMTIYTLLGGIGPLVLLFFMFLMAFFGAFYDTRSRYLSKEMTRTEKSWKWLTVLSIFVQSIFLVLLVIELKITHFIPEELEATMLVFYLVYFWVSLRIGSSLAALLELRKREKSKKTSKKEERA